MKKALIVVDMQNDFITGSLGTQEAIGIVENVKDKIRVAVKQNWQVYCTRDTHPKEYLNTREGKYLPVEHCIAGTFGQEIASEIQSVLPQNVRVIDKPTFGSVTLAEEMVAQGMEEIELVGLCTDICVLSNAILLKANLPEIPVAVDASCCAGVTPQSHQNALDAMKMCQIEIL